MVWNGSEWFGMVRNGLGDALGLSRLVPSPQSTVRTPSPQSRIHSPQFATLMVVVWGWMAAYEGVSRGGGCMYPRGPVTL
jgi:hypothetical protein